MLLRCVSTPAVLLVCCHVVQPNYASAAGTTARLGQTYSTCVRVRNCVSMETDRGDEGDACFLRSSPSTLTDRNMKTQPIALAASFHLSLSLPVCICPARPLLLPSPCLLMCLSDSLWYFFLVPLLFYICIPRLRENVKWTTDGDVIYWHSCCCVLRINVGYPHSPSLCLTSAHHISSRLIPHVGRIQHNQCFV